jgi:drug/metabolite transporter superfamily protein YnfA
MTRTTSILILALAALLEAGGDAIIRTGLHSANPAIRTAWFLVGALVLFAYGWTVNSPPWDFGRVLGLYVVFFFVAAQMISWLAFGQPPSRSVLLGGLLIVSGGFVVAASATN